MKNLNLTITIFLITILNYSFAQKNEKVDEKSKHYFKEVKVENTDYNLTLKNIVSTFEYLKFAVYLENKTSDFLLWNNKDSKAVFDFGEKNDAKTKTFQFKPNGASSRTFNVEGGDKFLVNNFKFILNGVYKVSTNGKVQKLADFKLPESTNTIKASDFTVQLVDSKRKTDETYVKFNILYNGDKVLVVKPDDISVRVNEKDIFANDIKKSTSYILTKGEDMSISAKFHVPASVADMQKSEMYIQWNGTFSISEMVPLKGAQVSVVLDEALTNDKK